MGLNIKNPEVERLAAEVATLSGVSKTEAIRQALLDRRTRLAPKRQRMSHAEMMRWLEEEVWGTLPPDVRGKPLTKAEVEDILGFGPGGV